MWCFFLLIRVRVLRLYVIFFRVRICVWIICCLIMVGSLVSRLVWLFCLLLFFILLRVVCWVVILVNCFVVVWCVILKFLSWLLLFL